MPPMAPQRIRMCDAQPGDDGSVLVLLAGDDGTSHLLIERADDAMTLADVIHMAAEKAKAAIA